MTGLRDLDKREFLVIIRDNFCYRIYLPVRQDSPLSRMTTNN